MYNSLCRANKHGFDHRSYKQAYIACTPSHPRLPFTYQLCSSASIPASHHGNGSVAYCDFEIRKGEVGSRNMVTWTQKMEVWKMIFLFNWMMFSFKMLNLQGSVSDTNPNFMHHLKGNPSNWPYICSAWSPKHGWHSSSPLVEDSIKLTATLPPFQGSFENDVPFPKAGWMCGKVQ